MRFRSPWIRFNLERRFYESSVRSSLHFHLVLVLRTERIWSPFYILRFTYVLLLRVKYVKIKWENVLSPHRRQTGADLGIFNDGC